MKILNLYAGIGGNRKLWGDEHYIVAIENNPEIARIYKDFFPNDEVIITDAHEFLLKNFDQFDFIWSSPPCQSHSRARFWASKGNRYKAVYPDMALYEEIIFLSNFFKGKWVVENTQGYYPPLIVPQKNGRHFFWSNFNIEDLGIREFPKDSIKDMQLFHGIDLSEFKIKQRKDQVLRNCVHPELGLYVLKSAFKNKQEVLQ